MAKHAFQYRPDVDGLRAIAVWSVVIYHAFPNFLSGGFAGVDVFFVISGFLISTILIQDISNGTFRFADFYFRRIRRIFPALSLVLFAVLIFGWFALLADELQQLGKHVASSAGFIQNFTLFKEAGYFDNVSETKPLLHIWSLGIEEQFYFLWPLLIWGFGKMGENSSNRALWLLWSMLLVFIVSLSLSIGFTKVTPTKAFYLPQYRFFELAAGGILSWLALYKAPHFERSVIAAKVRHLFAFAGISILILVFFMFDKATTFPGAVALLPVLGTALIILAGPHAFFNRIILSNKFLVWFGLVSYPLYLWHWPILSYGRIILGELPPFKFSLVAIAASVFLSWITVKFVEKPFRFSAHRMNLKAVFLCLAIFSAALLGVIVQKSDFSASHRIEALAFQRKALEHGLGTSLRWYRGKNDWLFLGNAFDNSVAKLKLAALPSEAEIKNVRRIFSDLASAGSRFNTKIALLVAPNKSSIYPEYLPDEIKPSPQRYISFFLEKLNGIPNLIVVDPTHELRRRKKAEGLFYFRTDSHWNDKGAFIAYSAFSKHLGLPIPDVTFVLAGIHHGDLLPISNLTNFPIQDGDNWQAVLKKEQKWKEESIPGEQETSFGLATIVRNPNPLSNKSIWVVGDSFGIHLRKYFNSAFREVRYVGHWQHKLKRLPTELEKAQQKPDLIIVESAERLL